jgi:molecular chaperone IbpA|tara:strand:- start:4737 stop:5162 length:426 start_codon:yes stop_codon:yes gene_type:complete
MTRLTTLNLPDFYKATIGFDRLFDDLTTTFASNTSGGYPPYNIVKVSESSYSISLAVAGFDKDEIKVEQDGNQLSINAEKKDSKEEIEYLYKGIGTRNFRREFSLADYVEVKSSKLDNGILVVTLEQNIPDEKKPRNIKID